MKLREQLEKTGRQYRENLNSVEQERDALKQQVEEWVKMKIRFYLKLLYKLKQ